MTRTRAWLLGLLCFLLVGCSTRLIYYWLDWAIVWQLDDYFSLTRDQRNALDREVRGLMAWHRKSEIPAYGAQLKALSEAVASPMTTAQVDKHLAALEGDLDRLIGDALPRAVRLGEILSDAQFERFLKERRQKLAQKREEFRRSPRDKELSDFTEKMNKRLLFWIGEVKPAQAPLVARWVEWQYELYGPWLDYQLHWWDELEQVLRLKGTPEFAPALERLLASGDNLMGGRYTGYTAQSRQRTVQWLSDLSTSLDLSQRAHLYGLLKGYADDFMGMARR
ncbi:DUF6279 family lipoprotein [Aeromonas schubertii]|uniref:DUF6279 family lipoprotein n=2 Tax=Aeromonas TaxID=642 RepID=A0A0S2SNF3_9GAMM|nr:DUF6279 family lipoprotein [Aeromonas schubertii]ALP43172.1 hypothetical protein WL1483_3753 [Aeromonas schubertii]KUE79143.1 hypothetical protein ATO46_07545 [Aeromonas schubertii]MBZ6067777.1 DUF6279 family lipoprotein [Aeromonas schubertii]MBZ6071921.1 DUF6279 family lipoprotein [Aeromonas schubertii]QCG48094.1 hypothetical protein E2P79_09770 [Aeromonas schubertii]